MLFKVIQNDSFIENAEGIFFFNFFFLARTSDRWIAHKQDFVVYLAKQFSFPLAIVQLIFHSRGCCWWLQSEFNIHLPTISRACHFGAGALFHALIHAAISSN